MVGVAGVPYAAHAVQRNTDGQSRRRGSRWRWGCGAYEVIELECVMRVLAQPLAEEFRWV